MGRRSGCKPDLNRVEMIQRVTPERDFLRRVPPVALIGDNKIKGMNWDVQLVRIVIRAIPVTTIKDSLLPK